MSEKTLAIITTRLPPAVCGVGAHSALLRKHWPETAGAVELLVIDGAAVTSALMPEDRITQFDGNAATLERALERLGAADVVLHYAGRAYHRFGCPVWLPGVIARWKRRFHGRLLVFVHEVPGEMPVTSPHFWLGKINAWILKRLAASADVLVTNTEAHRVKLQRISGRDNIQVVPVGSNIEAAEASDSPRVRTEFILFGLSFGRWQTLQMFDSHIRRWLADGQLTKLHIIGPNGDEFSEHADLLIAAWPNDRIVVRHGVLPSAEVARLLQQGQFALTNVTSETWSKSGAFMACAANACAPVIQSRRATIPLSYAIGSDEVGIISDEELKTRTRALRSWYLTNADWPIVATRLAALLQAPER